MRARVFSHSLSGTFADDTFRRLGDEIPGGANLDAAIRIHEELCEVVSATVSAFSLWFVFHWLLYGITCVLSIVYIAEVITSGAPWDNVVYIGIFVFTHFLLFLSPCCSAAYITDTCGGLFKTCIRHRHTRNCTHHSHENAFIRNWYIRMHALWHIH